MERVNVMREALLFKKELMEFYIEFSNKDPFQQDEIMQKILAVTKENIELTDKLIIQWQ